MQVTYVFALLQASALAVTVSPRCNADNCLRGLFGSNVKTVSANLAACSTGLPTVTVSVDGTTRSTMTGTAAPAPIASLCDGQGIANRASRFKSACSCVGVTPSTVTLTATQSQAETTTQLASLTTTQAVLESTTQAATQTSTQTTSQTVNQPQITLGQIAPANAIVINFMQRAETFGSSTGQISYVAPRAGNIIEATIRDAGFGDAVFQIWRPVADGSILVGKSELLSLTGTRGVLQFSFPQPIAVQEGDAIGLGLSGQAPAFTVAGGESIFTSFSGASTGVGGKQTFTTQNGLRANVAAILQ